MSKYTMTLRQIKENEIDIFKDIQYPIFDEYYRSTLNNNIINHYYFHEIGVETIGRFLFNLKARMSLIMPYYNKMYETTLLDQRIMDNYDVTETITNSSKDLTSDTPQGQIDLETSKYVSEISQHDDTTTRTMSGNIGIQTDADAIEKYRGSLLNVDLMIINELTDLFMQIY